MRIISGSPKLSLALGVLSAAVSYAQVNPHDMVKRMGMGINIGNTLDAPYEGAWADPVQEFFFDDYKSVGFTSVRIPIRWENHMDTIPPYSVDSTFMARVEQVVDWSLARGLVTIINAHHDDWVVEAFPSNMARFDSLWQQIALRFSGKSENLLFEVINEPYFDLSAAQVDSLNLEILNIIRISNPTRIVILTGGGANSFNAVSDLTIPVDDYLMAYYHYYRPFNFTRWLEGTWGSAADMAVVESDFDQVHDWAIANDIPVLLGEFGASIGGHRPSMLNWYGYISQAALTRGFAYSVWSTGPRAAKFTYYRERGTWVEDQLALLTQQTPYGGLAWIPGDTVEAEDFDYGGPLKAYADNEIDNTLGYYRPGEGAEIDSIGVDQYAVNLDLPGEWAEYSLAVDSTGGYEFSFDARSDGLDRVLTFRFTNSSDSSFSAIPFSIVPDTFATARGYVNLDSGNYVLRIIAQTGDIFLDRFTFTKLNNGPNLANLLINPGFEGGTSGWVTNGATMATIDTPVYAGNSALLISNRVADWGAARQDVTSQLSTLGQGVYSPSAFVRAVSDTGVTAKINVRLTYGGSSYWVGVSAAIDTSAWREITGALELAWTGTLDEALFFVVTTDGYLGDIIIDELTLAPDSLYPASVLAVKSENVPQPFELISWPNPFNPSTTISFFMAQNLPAVLTIYNLLGREVDVLIDETLPAGEHRVVWNASDRNSRPLPSGVYFAVLAAGNKSNYQKLVLVR